MPLTLIRSNILVATSTSVTRRARLGAALLSAAMAVGAFALAPAARAQTVLLEDDFATAGAPVDASKWQVSGNESYLQRTRFGKAPQVLAEGATTFARIGMDSYNPNAPGKFLGTELKSRTQWAVGNGIEWTARLRGGNVPKGLVYGFFTYRDRDYSYDRDQEEIDFEFLGNWINSTEEYRRRSIWANVWNYSVSKGTGEAPPVLDPKQWHSYTIRWLPNKVEWLIDGVRVREETDLVPDDQMALSFNIWAAGSKDDGSQGWDTAYDSGLATTTSPDPSRTTYFDVDYVRVTRLAAPTNLGSIGNGEGLTSVFYNSAPTDASGAPQYTNEIFAQISRRLNFKWYDKAIDSRTGLGPEAPWNGWGAVFKGEVQAQFSEPTTFSVRAQSSDGVRLWLGNQLVLSAAPAGGAETEITRTYTAPLQAGARYPIRVEFWDGTGAASLRLGWSSTSLPEQIISSTQLYPAILPTPSLTPAPGSYAVARTITASIAEPGTDSHYTLDGSEPLRTSPTLPAQGITLSASATLRVKAWKDGFWASGVAGGDYVIDLSPPVLSMTAPRQGVTYASLATASGTVAESGGSGLRSVTARLSRASDGKFWNAATSTWDAPVEIAAKVDGGAWSLSLPPLGDDSYTLSVQAVDGAGNLSAPSVASFASSSLAAVTVDAPSEGAFYTSLPLASGKALDTGAGVAEVRVSLKRSDGAIWQGQNWGSAAVDFAADYSAAPSWKLPLPALADGSYTLTVSALDASRRATTITRAFGIDAQSPVISIGGPAEGSILQSAFVLNGGASDAASGVAGVGVRIQRLSDGAFWNAGVWGADFENAARVSNFAGGSSWSLALPLLADGAYSAVAMVRDRAGNASQASVRWRLDVAAPVVSIASPASGGSASTWSAPGGTASDGASGSGVASVVLKLRDASGASWNGAAWTASEAPIAATLGGGAWSWPASVALPPATDGAYSLSATATDAAGLAATAQSAFSITAPVVTPTPAPPTTPVPVATPVVTVAPTPVPTATPAPDRVAPRASVASPPSGSVWRSLPPVRGLASDNVGVARAQVILFRQADKRYWNGSAWVAASTALQPTLSGNARSYVWSLPRLPQGASLPAGLYSVTIAVADGAGLRAQATSAFRVDLRAPAMAFASPSARVLTAPPARLQVRAVDDAAGTKSVDVTLARRSDGRYWNGRGWSVGAFKLALRAVSPTSGARPSAVLWQNGFALPPAAQWQPGAYVLTAVASDWVGNPGASSLTFTLAPPSPFGLSTASAQSASSSVTLIFFGPLDASTAQSPARFRASVGGVARQVLSARYSASARSVTLTLAGGVEAGERVQAWWSGLKDSSQRSLRDSATTLVAR